MRAHSGVGTYLRGLFPELVRRLPQHEWFVIQPGDGKWNLSGATLLACETPPLTAAEHLVLPRLLRQRQVDWLFVPHFNAPYEWPAERTLAVVHDLIPLQFPRLSRPWVPPVFRFLTERLLARSPLVVTDSVATATALRALREREYPVVYPGLAPLPQRRARPAAGTPYVLVLGGKAHKDAAFAVRVAEQLADDTVHWVIRQTAGEDGGATAAAVAASAQRERITLIDKRVPEEKLHDLYAGAAVFLFCSRVEGFGYPPLEAMQHGVPVVARRAGALPEVLGDAAGWFDGDDAAGAAAAVRALLTDMALRANRVACAHERCARYTWLTAGARMAELVGAAVA